MLESCCADAPECSAAAGAVVAGVFVAGRTVGGIVGDGVFPLSSAALADC